MPEKESLWILEDCSGHRTFYQTYLEDEFDIQFFTKLGEFEEEWRGKGSLPTAFIADINLPDGSFLELLKKESQLAKDIPILVVSSSCLHRDLETAYAAGASDYITKPFESSELLVKLRRLIRQHRDRKVDVEFIAKAGLTMVEFKIFSILNENYGNPVQKKVIEEQVWSQAAGGNVLNSHMTKLRKKLRAHSLEISYTGTDGFRLKQVS